MSDPEPYAALFRCPGCRGELGSGTESASRTADGHHCPACARTFPVRAGFLDFLDAPATHPVQRFYERQPFPGFRDQENGRRLRAAGMGNPFTCALDRSLPLDGLTLEAGCGTGQLSLFLAQSRRRVIGLDFCAASLECAAGFGVRNAIDTASFVRADLFEPPFAPGSFETVISLGVVHHTEDPERATRGLAALVRPGGFLILGVYHRFARWPVRVRGAAFRWLGHRVGRWLDPELRRGRDHQERRRAWIEDQYFHPLESSHRLHEVLGWLRGGGLEPWHVVPGVVAGASLETDWNLAEPSRFGSAWQRWWGEVGWVYRQHREGGLFVVMARRPER